MSVFNFKGSGFCVLLIFICASVQVIHAEGSKELNSYSGQRAYLFSSTVSSAPPPHPTMSFPTLGTMKVYAVAGESLYLGSSAQKIGSGTIKVKAPNGASYTSGTSSTVGRINDITEEMAGPLPNTGGYTPYIITVGASQTGVWEINFISPDANNVASYPTTRNTAAAWTQANYIAYIAAFDISVRNSANTAFIKGRVFTNIFTGCLGSSSARFYGKFQVITKDGYHYDVDNNGQAGHVFSFFANNKGFRKADGNASYKSVSDISNPPVQDPRAADSGTDITHKIFFNNPAADLPASASTPSGTTWLKNSFLFPEVNDFSVRGAEGTPGRIGTNPLGGYINFRANQPGAYIINIDVNQNGNFSDALDRKLTGSASAGDNSVYWDGLDGQKSKIPGSLVFTSSSIKITLVAGEVHFPFLDVENNLNGIIIRRVNGLNAPADIIYFDDTDIPNGGFHLEGVSSLTAGHKWGTTAYSSSAFGDNRGLDTWTYVLSNPLFPGSSLQLQEADLQIVSIVPETGSFCMGAERSVSVTVKNSGPAASSGAKFSFSFPSSFSSVSVSNTITGNASLSGITTTASSYSATLNIGSGASISFEFKGTTSNLADAYDLNLLAEILRVPDITDPDATNPDAAVPGSVREECTASAQEATCNNRSSLVVPVVKMDTPSISLASN